MERWRKGLDVHDSSAVTTYLFTDIEGSTRLWEQDPERMRPALARHDALTRAAVEDNHGVVVKTLGDGVHAAFDDPVNAIGAAVQLQVALVDSDAVAGAGLRVRCGLHAGVDERRDNDFFGRVVNRAARLMAAAHGGQILLSQAVKTLVVDRLPSSVTLRDLGAVRLRDLASAERVHQIVHPQLQRDFPTLRSLEATPNNLPQQLTSFIGREREQVELKALMANSRLVTLLGMGGLGKTRLSLQAAADLMDDFPDGVWFIDLASLTDESLVPQSVATVLAVKEQAGRPVLEALERHVADRRILLILDNCEHLMRACAETAKRLLQSGPHLKILASSREHLHLAGEKTFSVPILSVPDASLGIAADALRQYESVQLFLDRATAVRPDFRLSERNAGAIADICRRLDGIPLAIELAAARVNTLSVEQIAARLGDRFRLLTRGDRTALPRQQTLRALIDWSYDLLSDDERRLLQSLAVFAGGWTLDAAETVAAGEDIRQTDALDLLSNLVEKSLVISEADGGRYRLLETVRQYAQERLDESGERDRTRERHLHFFLAFAEKARPELRGSEQGAWLARLDAERENLLAAHAWCGYSDTGGELGLRLVYSMKPYWINRGLLRLGLRATMESLTHTAASVRNIARCRGLLIAGQLGCGLGEYKEAQGYLEESLEIAREVGDKERIAAVLQPLGQASLGQGDLDAARAHLEEALSLARELGNKREIAAAMNALAQLYRAEANLDAAEPLYQGVLAISRELGDVESVAIALLNLAMVSIGRGSTDGVAAMLLDVLAISSDIGSIPAGQSVLDVCAGLSTTKEQWRQAALFYGAAEEQAKKMGLRRDSADASFLMPRIDRVRDELGEPGFAAAEAPGRALSHADALAAARDWLEELL